MHEVGPQSPLRGDAMRMLAVAAVFVAAFLLRWATLQGLTGDDHYLLWAATNFLNGDRPFRDFVELGAPLYWAMSALGQVVTGHRVIGEVGLGTLLVAFAFAVSFHLAWRASASLAVALGLTALALLVMTQRELYSYTKLFIYPLAVWVCWRYIDRPTLLRAVVLALGVAVAWGYRHDHGAYVGVGAAAAVLAAHWREGPRRVAREWLRFGVALLLLLLPYLTLIQMNEGVVHYIQERVHLARVVDATSRRPVTFTVDASAPAYRFRIDPPRPGRMFVEWKPEVTNATRMALEQRYSLTNGVDPRNGASEPPDGRNKWEYQLTNLDRDNIRAIVEDSHVADTGLIDRTTYRTMEESWLIRIQRAIPLFRISVAPRYWHVRNAGVALHFLSLTLPYVMLLMLAADWIRGRRREFMNQAPEKMFAAAVMMAVAHQALLRREGYFADHIAVAVILGACIWGHAFGRGPVQPRRAIRIVSAVAAGIILMVATYATVTYASPLAVASTLGIGEGGFWNTSRELFWKYSTSPPIDAYAPRGTTGDRGLIRYVYECTKPDDRIWVLSDLFTLPYYAERRVVGHVYWQAGLAANPEFERRMIDKVDKAEVPLVIAVGGPAPLQYLDAYPRVREYAAQRYTRHYTVPVEGHPESVFWISTDSRRQPTGTYELLGLPCFR